MLHVVVIGNSLKSELVMAVIWIAAVPAPVNVMTALVNDVLPTMVLGNRKTCGLIAICEKIPCTPAPETATDTWPALAVIIVI